MGDHPEDHDPAAGSAPERALLNCLLFIGSEYADPRAAALAGHPLAAEARAVWDEGWAALYPEQTASERSSG